jgi:hypothetical protein
MADPKLKPALVPAACRDPLRPDRANQGPEAVADSEPGEGHAPDLDPGAANGDREAHFTIRTRTRLRPAGEYVRP